MLSYNKNIIIYNIGSSGSSSTNEKQCEEFDSTPTNFEYEELLDQSPISLLDDIQSSRYIKVSHPDKGPLIRAWTIALVIIKTKLTKRTPTPVPCVYLAAKLNDAEDPGKMIQMAKECMMKAKDVELFWNHLKTVKHNRMRDVEKAKVTRAKKKVESLFIWKHLKPTFSVEA